MGHKIKRNGVPVGTWGDKYDSNNIFKKFLIKNFKNTIVETIREYSQEINTVAEFGCGEGVIAALVKLQFPKFEVKASDYSPKIIKLAKKRWDLDINFYIKNIYELQSDDSADLIILCEVLEHLKDYRKALEKIKGLDFKYALVTVPREPIWRILQFISGNNIKEIGNTPGHVNHWNKRDFENLLSEYFEVHFTKSPFPWNLALVSQK
jgi:2-polyprenyl-3-methyl-5-hydroxy-6-metoxy-1,4-benzoquinol methylase